MIHNENNGDEAGLDVERTSRSPGPGDTSKDGSQHEPCAARIIVVKNATRDLSGSVEARNRRAIAAKHFCRWRRQHTAVGKGDAAAHTVRHKGWRVQAEGPVSLHGCDALGTFAVLDDRVEGPFLDRRIIGCDSTYQRGAALLPRYSSARRRR